MTTTAAQMPNKTEIEYFRSSETKDPSKFWERLKQAYLGADGIWQAADWRGFVFPAEPAPAAEPPPTSLESGSSSSYVSFVGQTFADGADLSNVLFRGHAKVYGATFTGSVSFANALFEQGASLDTSTFGGHADFQGARFQQRTTLYRATFQDDVNFRGALLDSDVSFQNAIFERTADFQQARFRRAVSLRGSAFRSQPVFDGAKFDEDPDLTDATVDGRPLVIRVDRVGNRRGAGNDRVAVEDQLNFSNYVDAFVELIRSADTKPPLTIGIFGSWGMGKSFLLDHIEREIRRQQGEPSVDEDPRQQRRQWRKIRRRQKQQDRRAQRHTAARQEDSSALAHSSSRHVHVVRFNAWEYSATDVIWPGLVRKIMDRLEVEIAWGFPGRFLYRLWRNVRRQIRENRGRLVAATAIAVGLVAFALWRFKGDKTLVGGAAVLTVALALAKVVIDGLSNPLSTWVTTLFEERDYGRQIGYMADIREDLEFLEHQLRAAGGRILVTIDDLDRCEPEKTVDVLQAINLLLNFDSFIVCVGIDARVISRAVEDHYKGLLGETGASGYEYLDKVVQIPFRIPEPTGEEIRTFLSRQMGDPQPAGIWASPAPVGADRSATRQAGSVAGTSQGVDRSREGASPVPVEEPVDFTWRELQAFQDLTAFLRPNPRHLKRLVNVYRLIRTLALEKGQTAIHDDPAMTTRWLAMCGQWPYTSYKILRCLDELLEDEQRFAQAQQTEKGTHNPLAYLYGEVAPLLCKDRQRLLDDDIPLFERLLDGWAGHVTWEQLRALRHYTINFNPAVEAELDSPTEDAAARLEPPAGGAGNSAVANDRANVSLGERLSRGLLKFRWRSP
jgi:uncharacterized protein YjbI with pentapeptide repeats